MSSISWSCGWAVTENPTQYRNTRRVPNPGRYTRYNTRNTRLTGIIPVPVPEYMRVSMALTLLIWDRAGRQWMHICACGMQWNAPDVCYRSNPCLDGQSFCCRPVTCGTD